MPRDRDMRGNANDEEVRTVFISGFPGEDMHDRELKNLARFLPGYEDSMVNRSNKGASIAVVGFVRFGTAEDAQNAVQTLDGLVYDDFEPEKTLRASMSKRNFESRPGTTTRRPREVREVMRSDLTLMQRSASNFMSQQQPLYAMQEPYMPHDPYNSLLMQSFAQPEMSLDRGRPIYDDREDLRKRRRMEDYQQPPSLRTSGCDTLCIQGLLKDSTEGDVTDCYERFEGYRCVNFVSKGKVPVGFVRFRDVSCAERAMRSTQDMRLPGGSILRVDFAKRSLEERGR